MSQRFKVPGLAGRAAVFAVLLIVGAWPWAPRARLFNAAHAAIANATLGSLTYGKGGHATIRPEAPPAQAGDPIVPDCTLALSVAGYAGEFRLGISVRRDVYLPLVLVVAIVVPAPLARRRKLVALGAALAAIYVLGLVATWLLVVWTFSMRLASVMAFSPTMTSALDVLCRALLLPPANRFIAPVVLAALLVLRAKRGVPPTSV